MSDKTKVELHLTSGTELVIQVTDYQKFVEQVNFRGETTVINDEGSGLNVFASAIATYKKVGL